MTAYGPNMGKQAQDETGKRKRLKRQGVPKAIFKRRAMIYRRLRGK